MHPHPSAPGSGVSGASPSHHHRNTTSGRGSSGTGAYIQGQTDSGSHLPAEGSSQPHGIWYYPTSSAGLPNAAKPSTSTSLSSAASMISPSSSFYNPDDTSLEEQRASQGRQYQQWIDAYSGHQQQQTSSFHPTFQSMTMGASQQNISSNPYSSLLQGNFVSSAPVPQYDQSTSAGMSSLPGLGDIDNTSTFHNAGNDLYSGYYPDLLSVGNSNSSTPENGSGYMVPTSESTHNSYTNTPEPLYQQQHQPPSRRETGHFAQQANHQGPYTASRQPQRNPNAEVQNREQATHMQFVPQLRQTDPIVPSSQVNDPQPQPASAPTHSKPNVKKTPQAKGSSTGMHSVHHFMPPNQAGPSQTKPSAAGPIKRATNPAPTSQTSGSQSEKAGNKRKKVKKSDSPDTTGFAEDGATDSGSDDYDDSGLGMTGRIDIGLGGLGVVGRGKRDRGSRLPGACTHCKKLKMKCDFPKNEDTCKRCKSGGHVCVVEGRRPRTAPNKREYLLAQIRQKDTIIESLLKQLHNPYIATPLSIASYRMATSPSDQNNSNILAWLDRLQDSIRDKGDNKQTRAFFEPRSADQDDDSDDSDGKRTLAADFTVKDAQSVAADDAGRDEDKLQSTLPETHVPLGLIADLSISSSSSVRRKNQAPDGRVTEDDLDDDNVGVANETYFMPGPATDLGMRASLIEQHSPPELLVHGLVKLHDVEKLFQIFYEKVNPFISLLDPVLHTHTTTFARCPFLFTVICAISSRYYAEKSEIYPIAMHFAKHSAANALIDGWKSVELCQAYILMSIYAVPARRWEEDRSWLYTGLAIRIATDLNLHQASAIKPTSEVQEREILNKRRVWMICFNLDRSTATQFGKPSTIKEDFILQGANDWYKKSPYNLPYDVHLSGYSELLKIVAKFHEEIFSDPTSPTGLNKKVDFRTVTLAHDSHLTRYHEEWSRRFKEDSPVDDPSCALRCALLPFLVSYSRLVMFSFGFQQAYQRGVKDGDSLFFTTCLDAAKAVVENMIDGLAPTGYMRFAPDGHFVFASFASAFLLKLLRPQFSSFLIKEQENEIFDLIGRLIQTLSSPKIAIDDRHTPKLYARFLAGLLSRHRRDGATVGRLQTNMSHSSPADSNGMMNMNSMMTNGRSNGISEQNFGSPPFMNQAAMDTPIYRPEATFAAGAGQISFGNDFEMGYSGSFSDGEMLATMQAIKNPAWWDTMMMPGFSWPEGSPSPPVSSSSGSSPYPYPMQLNAPTANPGFGIFHSAQVMM